eukprot:TRINITY_DN50576_c0_g1_i1.p1 TRINITY_DN50576_c0_g1~~TRINITY_DN50576_c0_g1_i1.p1  ORF type:complete len:452 (+),score=77.24 TRINITY_DN50576_c0_g1_i1:203-1357(+)
MAKLMRSFPELMLIIKGLAAAVRAVTWTLVLLLMIVFVFSILFTSVFHQGLKTDEEVEDEVEGFFGSMGKSMFSLIIMGTVLDDVTACSDKIRESNNLAMLMAFIAFIVLASFMMLNMLLGILVEVVANTAEGEKLAEKNVHCRQALYDIVRELADGDKAGITKEQFLTLQNDETMMGLVAELEITRKHIPKLADIIWDQLISPDEGGIIQKETVGEKRSPHAIVESLFRLQPGFPLQDNDLETGKKLLMDQRERMAARISALHKMIGATLGGGARSETIASAGLDESRTASGTKLHKEQSRNTLESDQTSSGPHDDSSRPTSSLGGGKSKITMEMLSKLNGTQTAIIIDEIRRRLGYDDLEESGVPLDWFDGDMQQRFRDEPS